MIQNANPLLEQQLTPSRLSLIHQIGVIAATKGMTAYLVGGPVRDVLLHRELMDLDFAVEGDALSLAKYLVDTHEAVILMHSQFLTTKVAMNDTILDLATTRQEHYTNPGALPLVQPGSIQQDLARRDFTINTMALVISPERFGELIDLFGGQNDLANGRIHTLHTDSFRDDPTRILRALRYEQRLNFHLSPETAHLARRDAALLGLISSDRLQHELNRIFQEHTPEKVLARAQELKILPSVQKSLRWNGKCTSAITTLRETSRVDPLSPLALLAYSLTQTEAEDLGEALNMPSDWLHVVLDSSRLRNNLRDLDNQAIKPSQVYQQLNTYVHTALAVARYMEKKAPRIKWLECYLTTLCNIRTELNGDDIKELGIQEGLMVGQILDALHRARLDSEIVSRDEEEALVRDWIWRLKNNSCTSLPNNPAF